MKFSSVALLTSVLATVSMAAPQPRQFCSEADRFGIVQITPNSLVPGDTYTIHTDFACGISKGYMPKYLDYYLEVPSVFNNGHQAPILLDRREFVPPSASNPSASITFTGQIPKWGGFVSNFTDYIVTLHNSYIQNTTDGEEIYLRGGVEALIDLTT